MSLRICGSARLLTVCVVPGLIHDVDVKVLFLLLEQLGAEVPELAGRQSQDCNAGLVDEC